MEYKIIFLVMGLMLISSINGLYQKEAGGLDISRAIRVEAIHIEPEHLSPGETGIIKIKLKNDAKFFIRDLMAKLEFPNQIKPYKDVNVVKISELAPGASKTFEYQVIVSPAASEDIYNINLLLDYTSYFGANFINVGQVQTENNSFGIIVKSSPKLFLDVDTTKVYKGNEIGEVSIKFVNNGIANIKFLTVSLEESDEYKTISSQRKYIGDLDSDDFESVEFRIKIKKNSEEIKLRFKIDYTDSLNKEYSDDVETALKILTADELGIKKSSNSFYFIIAVILVLLGYFAYKFFKKRRRHKLTA